MPYIIQLFSILYASALHCTVLLLSLWITRLRSTSLQAHCSSYRLVLILKDLPGLLLVAQLLDTFSLQVALLALLKQGIGSPVADQELRGCTLAQNWEKYKEVWPHMLILHCASSPLSFTFTLYLCIYYIWTRTNVVLVKFFFVWSDWQTSNASC